MISRLSSGRRIRCQRDEDWNNGPMHKRLQTMKVTPPTASQTRLAYCGPTADANGARPRAAAGARGFAGYVVSTPILAALALTLAACGGAAQVMDGTPHAGSISPTVTLPPGATTDYRPVRSSEPAADAGLAEEMGADSADGQVGEGVPPSDPDQVAAMPEDGTVPGASPDAAGPGVTAAQGTRLSERGFFGIAEPIRRAERPSAAPPQQQQPRQPTQQEAQAQARRDALASIVGQFDSPSAQARQAPAAQAPAQDPRIADVPDRPDDAPSAEELAAMRGQLESSRDRGRDASDRRTDRIEAESGADDPFPIDEPSDDEASDDEADSASVSDPAAMMGGVEASPEDGPDPAAEMAAVEAEPEPEPEPAAVASTVTIPFEAESTSLGGDASRMVSDLAGDPTLVGATIRVVGYATDDDGGESTARDRATAVADALNDALASAGVSGVSVQVEASVASADAPAAQASRVDIRINE